MDFKTLTELTEGHAYDELKIIGRDALMYGRRVHVVAMTKENEETVLYLLTKALKVYEGKQPNRQLIKDYTQNVLASMAMVQVNDRMFFNQSVVTQSLGQSDMESPLLLAKFMEAGWRLPQNSELFALDWNQVELLRCGFRASSGRLPDWEHADVSVVWAEQMKEHFVEMPVKIQVEDGRASASEKELVFPVVDADGTQKQAVCYINSIQIEDFWAQQQECFSNPDYRRKKLEKMTEQAYEDMVASKREALRQVCPQGMIYFVVECECTLDLQAQFYLSTYLRQVPDEREGTFSELFGVQTGEPQQGPHGLPLQKILVRQPVSAEETEVWVELFTAGEIVSEWKEKVEWL